MGAVVGVIDDLIAQAREQVAKPEIIDVKVVSAGVLVQLVFTKLLGAEWIGLTATHPPREGATLDGNLGFNIDGTAGDYPAEKVTIAGEVPSQPQWQDFYKLLDAPHRHNVATALWSINQFAPAKELADLGKASRAGSRKKQN